MRKEKMFIRVDGEWIQSIYDPDMANYFADCNPGHLITVVIGGQDAEVPVSKVQAYASMYELENGVSGST